MLEEQTRKKRRKRKPSRCLRAVSVRPRRDLVDRLTRELQRSKVAPAMIEQAAVAFQESC